MRTVEIDEAYPEPRRRSDHWVLSAEDVDAKYTCRVVRGEDGLLTWQSLGFVYGRLVQHLTILYCAVLSTDPSPK
jgi:hypothetical protein